MQKLGSRPCRLMKTRTVPTQYTIALSKLTETDELHVPHKRRNKKKSLGEGKKVVEKRGVLQKVLKGTNEEVRPKASKVEDAMKDLDRAYAEE